MVGVTANILAKRQTIIYGVKRGKIPAVLRPNILPEKKESGSNAELYLLVCFFVFVCSFVCCLFTCLKTWIMYRIR